MLRKAISSCVAGSSVPARRALLRRGLAASASPSDSPAEGHYPGEQTVPFVETPTVQIQHPHPIPAYRIMDNDGSIRAGAQPAADGIDKLRDEEAAVSMYATMVRLQAMDQVFYDAQRQGRISFYMTSGGEEAVHIGSAAALNPADMIFAQYREPGVLMWRGFSLQQFADQCFGNCDASEKGRQMPVHYGSAELNFQTISSPLATQIPQASGAAYAYKLAAQQAGKAEVDRIAVCYFGDGAASEGDFHPALNMAATLEAPVLFFCRNNGFAISTPIADQFRGDGIASRASGYGMASIRVDGNDLFAVYDATRRAREYIVREGKPCLVESMAYRQGHHSTSDDSTRYREIDEIKHWKENDDPLLRTRAYLEAQGWWSQAKEEKLREVERANVLVALEKAEHKDKPALDTMFEDVYKVMPTHLARQQAEMLAHVAKYPDQYPVGGH